MPAPPLRVLLIEDDDAFAGLLESQLADASTPIALHRARSLREASQVLGRGRFDVVLLDLGLPDASGLETLRRIQAHTGDLPIVVLTAHDDDASAIAALQAGAEDYLVKGQADVELLTRAIRYACERSALRRELVEREARFRALVEHSSDAITLVDEHMRAIYNSRAIERVTGYTPEELLGQPIEQFLHPDDLAGIKAQFARVLESPGAVVPGEYRFRHRDGTWRHGEAIVVNHLNDAAVRAVVANHRDVTERYEAAQALNSSVELLRQAQKMEAVGRLASGVAHDFNNVLTAIFGYTDLLLEQFVTDDPRRGDIEEIRRAAERAATLTRQLLAFSRRQVMQPRILDPNDVVTSLEKLLARLVGEDIQLAVRLTPGVWTVRADSGQIEQVLMNLCANARDAMPEGGHLTISTENREVTEEDLHARAGLVAGSYVVLTVADSGAGMSEEVRMHLFEPFFTTKERGKGTGLGLATVYGIVKQSRGYIYVESAEGQGTRFFLYLPRDVE